MQSVQPIGFGRGFVLLAASSLALAACSKKIPDAATDASADAAVTTETAPAAPAATATKVAADNTDTLTGVKLASYTGDAAKGEIAFATCKTCHAIEVGENKIGPSLHGVVGRLAGSIAGYSYSTANKTSGITWTPEKLFQYLEGPQRIVPGTKMAFPGFPEPQKRADVIAYLKANS